jgi:hypothetical protein
LTHILFGLNCSLIIRSHFVINLTILAKHLFQVFLAQYYQYKMMNSLVQYGATTLSAQPGVAFTRFKGTEGQQEAIQLRRRILIALGQRDTARFLTTPLQDILKEIDAISDGAQSVTVAEK